MDFLKKQKMRPGFIAMYVFIFGAVFIILIGGTINFIIFQLRNSERNIAWNSSLHIAEAGIEYYRWCLNHGVEANCQAQKDYLDSSGQVAGTFSISAALGQSCGQTVKRNIISTGFISKFPNVNRKIEVVYARPSVAQYSYVLNSDVWIGDDHQINGPYHSNGGIRMDGENQSIMTSARNEWICTSSFGCSSCPTAHGCRVVNSNCTCSGVFTTTTNGKPDLFKYPYESFDFTGITVDLAQMKGVAISSGVYLPKASTINSLADGYHIIFRSDGKFDVRIITNLNNSEAYNLEEGWHYDSFVIPSGGDYWYATYDIPSSCSAIFAEDNIWVEGEINGKQVVIASANLVDSNVDTSAVLVGNIDYHLKNDTEAFALVAEKNVFIGPQSPDNMVLRGIYIAQKGYFSRNHYPNNFRNSLSIYGSVVSSGRVGTQWISGGQIISGYSQRQSYYDPNLIFNSPPFMPIISSDFSLYKWEEVKN